MLSRLRVSARRANQLNIFIKFFHTTSAFNSGGIIARRCKEVLFLREYTISVADAFGKMNHKSAIAPVTNGAAKIVLLI
jgi:hypothetical protein